MKLYPLAIALLLSVPVVQCMEDEQPSKQQELTVNLMREKLVKVVTKFHNTRKKHNEYLKKSGNEPLLVAKFTIQVKYGFRCGRPEPSYTPQDFINKFTNDEIMKEFQEFEREKKQGGKDSMQVRSRFSRFQKKKECKESEPIYFPDMDDVEAGVAQGSCEGSGH